MRIAHALPIGLLVALAVSSAAFAADPSCREAVEPERSATYVAQCLAVSPATHPPCNAANPCGLITDEIRRGCAILRESLRQRPARAAQGIAEPDFCKSWLPE